MNQPTQPVFARKQLLIDENVQGSLLKRAAFYSVACVVYFMVILVFTESMSRQDASFAEALMGCLGEAIYWAPGLLLMTPLVAYDMLKQTNRFAGPVFRLRREMRRLIAGESDLPLSFRNDDYWTEMADDFNAIREELLELRKIKAEYQSADRSSGRALFDDSDDDSAGETADDDLLNSLVG